MGDDLYIAREFSNAALADISAIGAMEHRCSAQSAAQISLKLAQLQSGAKRARARAIYQSAQIAIEALNPKTSSSQALNHNFDMRFNALSKLIAQYAHGLSEVEAAEMHGPVKNNYNVNDDQNIKAPTPPETLHRTAKTTLTSLMPLARIEEVTGLQALIDYDYTKEPPAQKTPAIKFKGNPNQHIKTDVRAKIAIKEMPINSHALIPLEYVLRDAIQDALSIARISGKTISVSYDVGQEHIESIKVKALEKRLCEGLRALVLQSLPQDDIGHIDINLRGNDMIIHSKYKQPSLLPYGLTSRQIAAGCEISLPLDTQAKLPQVSTTPPAQADNNLEGGSLDVEGLEAERLDINSAEITSPETISPEIKSGNKAPMITQATEAQLRAQLAALLDSSNKNHPDTNHENKTQADELSEDALHMDDNIIVMTEAATAKPASDTMNTSEIGSGS